MRTILKVVASIAFAASTLGCAAGGDNPVQPLATSTLRTSSAESGPVTRPYGGKCDTDIFPTTTRAGYAFSLYITGVCNLKHLGRTTIVIDQDFAYDGSIVNSTTHTAANGDLLRSTWYSAPGETRFDGVDAVFAGIETYAGGTGRFANATGSSLVRGTAHFDASTHKNTGQFTTVGTITY